MKKTKLTIARIFMSSIFVSIALYAQAEEQSRLFTPGEAKEAEFSKPDDAIMTAKPSGSYRFKAGSAKLLIKSTYWRITSNLDIRSSAKFTKPVDFKIQEFENTLQGEFEKKKGGGGKNKAEDKDNSYALTAKLGFWDIEPTEALIPYGGEKKLEFSTTPPKNCSWSILLGAANTTFTKISDGYL